MILIVSFIGFLTSIPSVHLNTVLNLNRDVTDIKRIVQDLTKQNNELQTKENFDEDKCHKLVHPLINERKELEIKIALSTNTLDELSQAYAAKVTQTNSLAVRCGISCLAKGKNEASDPRKMILQSEYGQLKLLAKRLEGDNEQLQITYKHLTDICDSKLNNEKNLVDKYKDVFREVSTDLEDLQKQLQHLEMELHK